MNSFRKNVCVKSISILTAATFLVSSVSPVQAQSILNLPPPGVMVQTTDSWTPLMMNGLTIDPVKPLHFEFLMDLGQSGLQDEALQKESEKLIKYFLASLTIPEEQKWVNLSPYEKDRLIPDALAKTEMGRDMLAQDYMLKQLTSSLMHPEQELGKNFWERVYAKAALMFGSTDIPLNTFNKIWITPDKAVVYEYENVAYIAERHLKVYLEEDYLALEKNMGIIRGQSQLSDKDTNIVSGVTSQVVREVLIPEIEREVNEGQIFAPLRQIYNGMILATWYRQALKESLLAQVYANQEKTPGVEQDDPAVNRKIYEQYVQAFNTGVYNLLKEDYDPVKNEMVIRKYFSGGAAYRADVVQRVKPGQSTVADAMLQAETMIRVIGDYGVTGSPEATDPGSKSDAMLNANKYFVDDVLADANKKMRFFDPLKGQISEESLPVFSAKLDEQYNERFLGGVASSAERSTTKQDLKYQHLLAEFERMKIVKQWFDIGESALDLEGRHTDRRNYMAAMWAFNKVKEMKPLLRDAFAETTLTSDAFKPIKEVYDFFLTIEKAEDLKELTPQDLGLQPSQFSSFRQALEEYLATLNLIKLADKRYRDSYQRYMAQTMEQSNLGTAAVENIIFDLRMSDYEVFRGLDNSDGRSFKELLWAATALRELMYSNNPQITNTMKTQAAYFLSVLFGQHMRFGSAYAEIDQRGGLMVSQDVQRLDFEGKSLEDMKEAETEALLVFGDFTTGQGIGKGAHSETARSWLSHFYRKLGDYFYFKHGDMLLEKESQQVVPEMSLLFQQLAAIDNLDEKLRFYEERFPRISEDFLNGKFQGVRGETPVRIELQAAGIGDSSFWASSRPYLLRGLFNGSLLLNRNDGTLGRPIETTFQIMDRDQMPATKKGRALISVQSLDRNFRVDFADAGDILKKTKGDLVIQTFVSMGLLPHDLMKKAKQEGREREVLEKVLKHFLGEGKGLFINLYVNNIQQASGLAVSSMISAVNAQTVHEVTAAEAQEFETEHINRLTVDISEDAAPGAYYYVEVGADNNFAEGKTYRFAAKERNGRITVDLPVGQFPEKSESGRYSIRYVKIQDEKFEGDSEVIEDEQWTRDIPADEFVMLGDVELPEQGDETSQSHFEGKAVVTGKNLQYRLIDDQKSVERAIYGSQFTVRRLAGKAGVQDEVAGWEGGLRILNGQPGRFIPEMMKVSMPKDAMDLLSKQMKIMRIGKSQPAEDTLDEVFYNTILNRSLSAQYAWAQVSINSVMEAQQGNILGLGRLALAAVALRHQVAPVSIDYVTANTMNQFLYEYGERYGLYGVTGARMGGSITLYPDSLLSQEEIADKMYELSDRLYDAFMAQGKLELIEQKPTVYPVSAISPRGARAIFMDAQEMTVQEHMLKATAAWNRALALHNEKTHVLYTADEYLRIKEENGLNTFEDAAKYDPRPALTMDPELYAVVKQIVEKAQQEQRPISEPERQQLRNFAEDLLKKKYRPFEPKTSFLPGYLQEKRDRTKRTINIINTLSQRGDLNAAQERAVMEAFQNTAIAVDWPLEEEDILMMADIFSKRDNAQERDNLAQSIYQKYDEAYEEEFQAIWKKVRDAQDGRRIDDKDFYKALGEEMTVIRGKLQGKLSLNERRKLKVMMHALDRQPNPLLLPANHFLFRASETYRNAFEKKIALMKELIWKGALVPDLSAGGMGSRFFGGKAIKGVYPFHFGQMADANFLYLLLIRWADLFKQFPQGVPPLIKVQTSVFTKDAVEAQIQKMAEGAGLSPEQILLPEPQSLGQAFWVRPEDMLVQILNITASTPEEYAEKVRDIQRMLEEAERQTAAARKKDPAIVNAPYNLEGSNPLLTWNPRGNVGVFEVDHRADAKLTLQNLKDMGYQISEARVKWMIDAGLEQELERGLTLAKANYLVEGPGLSYGVTQNVSNLGLPGGGEMLLAESLFLLNNNPKKFAVAQYVTTAGSPESQGGVLAVDENDNVVVLEMDRMTLAEGAIFDGYAAFNTNTVVFNRDIWMKILDFSTEKDFLTTPAEEIHKRMWKIFTDNQMVMYTLKDREYAVPGQSYKYKVVQGEVSVARFLEYVQKKLGNDAVEWVEAPIEAFEDPKERSSLGEALGRETTHRTTRSKTLIPQGEVEDPVVSAQDWLTRAEEYLNRGEDHLAGLALFHGGKALKRLKGKALKSYDARYAAAHEKFNKMKMGTRRQMSFDERVAEETLTELSRQWDIQYHPTDGNIYEMFAQGESRYIEGRLELIHNNMERIKSELVLGAGLHNPLLTLLEDIMGKDDIDYNIADTIIMDMEDELILGESLEVLIERFFGKDVRVTGAPLLRVKNEFQKNKDNEKNLKNKRGLVYMRQEFNALYASVMDDYLQAQGRLEGIRTSQHKTMIMTDKDATIETPGEELKQSPFADMTPNRARILIDMARRGELVKILTGSTYAEGFWHVLDVVRTTLDQYDISNAEKQMILKRLEVLANDGTVRARLVIDDVGIIKNAEIEFVNRYFDGQFYPPTTLFVKFKDGEAYRNRTALWTANLKAYLKQLFNESGAWKLLTGSDQRSAADWQAFLEFVDRLKVRGEMLSTQERRWYQDGEQVSAYLNVHVSMADILADAMSEELWSEGTLSPGAKEIAGKVRNIIAPYYDRENNVLDEKRFFEMVVEDPTEPLTREDQLFALLGLIHFKDSAWTYGSISGDALDQRRKDERGRFSSLIDLVLNPGFWDGVAKNFLAEIEKIENRPNGEGSGFYALVNGEQIQVIKEIRPGPGYLNMAFGGVNKKTTSRQFLESEKFAGWTFVFSGDSYKDQGDFPYKLITPVKRISGGAETPTFDALKELIGAVKNEIGRQKLMALRGRIKYEEKENIFSFEGEMSEKEYKILKSIQITLNGDSITANGLWQKVVDDLYAQSNRVFKQRISLRYLLGSMFELNAEQIEAVTNAGLLRMHYMGSMQNPFDITSNERWGPATFYFMLEAVERVVNQNLIIPFVAPGESSLEMLTRMERAVIEAANRIPGTPGSRFIPSSRLYEIRRNDQEQHVKASLEPGRIFNRPFAHGSTIAVDVLNGSDSSNEELVMQGVIHINEGSGKDYVFAVNEMVLEKIRDEGLKLASVDDVAAMIRKNSILLLKQPYTHQELVELLNRQAAALGLPFHLEDSFDGDNNPSIEMNFPRVRLKDMEKAYGSFVDLIKSLLTGLGIGYEDQGFSSGEFGVNFVLGKITGLADDAQLTQADAGQVKTEINQLLDKADNGFNSTVAATRRFARNQVVVDLKQLKNQDPKDRTTRYEVQIKPANDGPAVMLKFSRPQGPSGMKYVGLDEVIVEEATTITMDHIREALKLLLRISDKAQLNESLIQLMPIVSLILVALPFLNKSNYGGINLNDKLLNLEVRKNGSGVLVPVDNALLQELKGKVPGFTPIITDIRLIPSIPAFLSQLGADASDSNSASSDNPSEEGRLSFGPMDHNFVRL